MISACLTTTFDRRPWLLPLQRRILGTPEELFTRYWHSQDIPSDDGLECDFNLAVSNVISYLLFRVDKVPTELAVSGLPTEGSGFGLPIEARCVLEIVGSLPYAGYSKGIVAFHEKTTDYSLGGLVTEPQNRILTGTIFDLQHPLALSLCAFTERGSSRQRVINPRAFLFQDKGVQISETHFT